MKKMLCLFLLSVFSGIFYTAYAGKAPVPANTSKTDVWDFGAAQLDETLYTNRLTEDFINSLYAEEPVKTGISFPPGFTAGALSWTGGGNDRLRTSNTRLTRYDSNGSPASFEGETFTGSLYVNASAAPGRHFTLVLGEDDEAAIYAKSQNGTGKLIFEYADDNTQKDTADLTDKVGLAVFAAKKAGSYRIYDAADKPFYYRITRKDAVYVTLSGTINTEAAADIPSDFRLTAVNEAGKEYTAVFGPVPGSYSIKLPAGYAYTLALANANGYIITNGTSVEADADKTKDIVIVKASTCTLSGSIEGIAGSQLESAGLVFTPDEERAYVPAPQINKENSTYTVDIEPGYTYTISATGINDYYITNSTVNITEDAVRNITFALKPVYKVHIATEGLTSVQASKLIVTFSSLSEPGYAYTFTDLNDISLRSGVYSIACTGLDEYPLQLGPVSNLKVEDAEASKTLMFKAVANWPFNDAAITSGTSAYKGMLFTGSVYNEINKGHLVLKDDAAVKIPVNAGEKVVITYYYSAAFSVDGGPAVETASGSTSIYETAEFVYGGSAAGYMTINNLRGTSYITDITTVKTTAYKPVVAVGPGREYQTINDALEAVRSMPRPASERVKIMVDPGNYEEMLVIDIDSISIINASANPGIGLLNQGVDIESNAVRITSYYGHGYDYYSMGPGQKWSADALRVNKENGYTSSSNTGSGTGNQSYWNATVVVSGCGFEASHIIFENSFNQYISRKESEDVVVEWPTGGKGTRPAAFGSTEVQNKRFVERAAAIAYTAGGDKSVLYKCRIVGRQDSFYGAEGARVVTYKGSLMGGTDYIFGGMTLTAYQSSLAMNTSDVNTDAAYITAAQQSRSRGFLMYNCTITSAQPGTETASEYLSKPGYLGRPWQGATSEVVFYNTIIKATDSPAAAGRSMIVPAAWNSTLGGESDKCYEYGTVEESGEDNSTKRAPWSHVLDTPVLHDGTEITPFNFTKGTDNWDPIPALIRMDEASGVAEVKHNTINLSQAGNKIIISGINTAASISIYGIDGSLISWFSVDNDTCFELSSGVWIVKASNTEGEAVLKSLVP